MARGKVTTALFSALAALVAPIVAASHASLAADPILRGWLDHVVNLKAHLLQDVAVEKATAADGIGNYTFETKWFDQKVDHFNKQNSGHFWQRYFVYGKFSQQEIDHPIFVFCGGEQGDIYMEWQRYGFMLE